MTFASFDRQSPAGPIADINMVPLIDVMLVLLVIFIITAPFLTHAVRLDLPKASSTVDVPAPARIDIAIDAAGRRYWNGEPVSRDEAARRFVAAAASSPRPEVHLRADETVPYRFIAEILADTAKAGLTRIAFVSRPDRR